MSHEARKGGRRMNWLVDEYVRHFFKEITELIRAAQKAGQFVEGEPAHLLYIFVGAVTHLFMLAAEVKKVSGKSPTSQAYVEEHVKLCLGLFFRTPGEPQADAPGAN
jgi:TetR/AcrR family transcriptional regulator